MNERDLKNLTNAIASDIINEINNLKDAIEKQNKRFSQELKENSLESSEKANQLSIYIDDQVKNLSNDFMKRNDKIKQIFTKLAEQLKNHLITYDASKRELANKVALLEKGFDEEKLGTLNSFKSLENNIKSLIKDTKYELETLLLSKFSVVADKCLKIQEQLNSDIDLVKEAIDNSRSLLLNKINKLIENYGVIHEQHFKNFQNLLIVINDIKNGMKTFSDEVNTNFNEVCSKIIENEAKEFTKYMAEKTLRESQFMDFFNLIRETAEEINKGVLNLKILIENEERTRVFERDQNKEGLEQLNDKIDYSKKDFDSFFEDFKVFIILLKIKFQNTIESSCKIKTTIL